MKLKTKTPSEINFDAVDICSVNLNSESALRWLTRNTDNRRVRRNLVEYLKTQIKSGEWQSDHPQPIVFANTGRLIDGQHRLYAIAESGLSDCETVTVRVETGARECIREYLDTGISRNLEDRVAMAANYQLNKFAAQLVSMQFMLTSRARPTPDDAREFWDTHSFGITWAHGIRKRERGVGAIPVAMAAVEFYERSAELADDFYRDLFKPAGDIQQAQMLRDFLVRPMGTGHNVIRLEMYQKTIGCMKAFSESRPVKKVLRASTW